MKSHYRVVVIGGGIVGTSVLYHLTRLGWTDVALIERSELTAGSTWHAAAGFHALNDDPNIAALQAYTIKLYGEIEKESGQDVGMHMLGGYSIATTPSRWEWLKAEWALYETLGIGTRLATPEEIVADCPIVDSTGLLGGLYDPHEGKVDPHGTTHATPLHNGGSPMRGSSWLVGFILVALPLFPALASASPTKTVSPAKAAAAHVVAQHVARSVRGSGRTPASVAIVEGRLQRAANLIAWVDVKGDLANRRIALELLREQAAAVGADAIVNVQFHGGARHLGHYTATAVKYSTSNVAATRRH